MKRSPTITFLMPVGLLLIATLWITGTMLPTESKVSHAEEPNNLDDRPFDELNRKARLARSGDDRVIQELTDEAFKLVALPQFPTEAVKQMKDRVVRAELEYRKPKGKQNGIDEADTARLVNHVANTLSLPDYAKTSTAQVRSLRMGLWPMLPNFIGQEDASARAKPDRKAGSKVSSKMSPIEAAFVSLLMLQQKQRNEHYQVAPQHWRHFLHQKKTEQWLAGRKAKAAPQAKGSKLRTADDNPKVKELTQAVHDGVAKLSPSRIENLPNELLDVLGIMR